MRTIFLLLLLFVISISSCDKNVTAVRYENSGNAKLELKDYYGAIVDYSKAIEYNPRKANPYLFRGSSKFFLHDYHGAIADYNKANEIRKSSDKISFRALVGAFEGSSLRGKSRRESNL